MAAKPTSIPADYTRIPEGEMDTIPIPGFRDPFSSLSHLVGAFVFLIYGIKLIFIARVNPGLGSRSNGVCSFGCVFTLHEWCVPFA